MEKVIWLDNDELPVFFKKNGFVTIDNLISPNYHSVAFEKAHYTKWGQMRPIFTVFKQHSNKIPQSVNFSKRITGKKAISDFSSKKTSFFIYIFNFYC